jgi:hypothetical protein
MNKNNKIKEMYNLEEWPVTLKTPEQRRKHNYPKNRKKGVFKNSQKYELLQRHSKSHIEATWKEHGMYEAGKILDANPRVIWHMVREYGWTRPLPDFLTRAAQAGNWQLTENYFISENDDEAMQ